VSQPATGLTLYCFSLGLVAAVNPCGFPILPAYLTLSSADDPHAPLAGRVVRALGAGVAVTAGFVLVFAAIGTAIKAGAGVALGWLPWVMVPVGVGCFALGVFTVAGRGLKLRVPTRRLFAGRRRAVALVGFGVTYAVASLACALPLFVGAVAGSFTERGTRAGLADGLAYAFGMGLVICAVSLAGVGAQQLRLRWLRRAQPFLQRLAGVVLCAVGAYLVLYWLNDALAPTSTPGPVRVVGQVQADLQTWLSASPRVTGAVIALVVLVALALACVALLRRPIQDT
jgi:cytochrome c biogenesis protein CcdA